jgi:hypothetical protein
MLPRSLLPFLAAVTLLPDVVPSGLPDEGQWLPTQVRDMDWDALKKRGMVLTKDEFWHPENGGVLSATVQINGCTASFVSADGLLVTNHHCGFGAVTDLSDPQHNYLRDGFAAADKKAELHAEGMVASVLKRIEDIKKRQQQFQRELALFNEAGKGSPPARLQEEITNAEIDLKAAQSLLEAKKKETQAINARYDDDKRRYQEAVGKKPKKS